MRCPHLPRAIWATIGMAVLATPSTRAGWGGPLPIEVAPVREELLGATIYLTGDLRVARQAMVGAEVEGRVAEVFVDEGTEVAVGDPLIRLDVSLMELRVAREEARLEAARARLVSAQIDHDSQRPLAEQGVVSETRFAEIEATYRAAAALVAELEATMELSREELERATVRAPFDGVVASLHTELGQWMEEGGNVVELQSRGDDAFEVVVEVPELAIPRVEIGMRGLLLVDALPGQPFEGEVLAIEPVADLANRTYPVHVRVLDPSPRLLPGMFVRVAVETQEPAPTLLMPGDAVVDRGRGPEAWLVTEGLDGLTANPQRVEVGRRRGADIEVLSGLEVGERVVVAGHESIFPGATVTIVEEKTSEPVRAGGASATD